MPLLYTFKAFAFISSALLLCTCFEHVESITLLSKITPTANSRVNAHSILNIYEYLSNYKSVIIKNDPNEHDHNGLLENLIPILAKKEIPMLILNEENAIEEAIRTQTTIAHIAIVINVKSCELLTASDIKLELNTANEYGHIEFLVMVPDHCHGKIQEFAPVILESDYTFILYSQTLDTVKVINFKPKMNPITCQREAQEVTIEFASYIKLRNVYSKPRLAEEINFQGCPLKVGVRAFGRYAVVKEISSFGLMDKIPPENLSGPDIDIVSVIASRLNANVEYYYLDYYLSPENLAYVNDKVDILVGGVMNISTNFKVKYQFSIGYINEKIYFVYYAERSHRSWKYLVNTTNKSKLVLFFIASFCVTWYIISHFDNRGVTFVQTCLYSAGAILGGTQNLRPRSFKQKILYISFWILCMHQIAFFNSKMYSFLVVTKPPEEVYRSDVDLLKSRRTINLSNVNASIVLYNRIINYLDKVKECNNPIQCYQQSIDNKGMCIAIDNLFYSFQKESAIKGEAKLLPVQDPFYNLHLFMLTRKHSPVNKLIARMYEAGIINNMVERSYGPNVLAYSQLATTNLMQTSYSCQFGCIITMADIAFAFYILLGGCALSCCVFLVEMLKLRNS